MLSRITAHQTQIIQALAEVISRTRRMGDQLYGSTDMIGEKSFPSSDRVAMPFQPMFEDNCATIDNQLKMLDQELNRLEGFFESGPEAPRGVPEQETWVKKHNQLGINY